jgi:hypothetical protein
MAHSVWMAARSLAAGQRRQITSICGCKLGVLLIGD